MDQLELDFSFMVVVANYLFRILIIFVICFAGAISSDIWYYKRDKQPINIVQDIIASLFFATLMNILDDYIKWNQKVFIGVSFFIGIFGIDLLGLVLQPKFLIIFIKNFFGELKSNPAAKALSNTIKEYKQDDDKAKEKEEKDKRRQERQQQKQEQEVQENTSDSKPPEARSISPPSHVNSGRFGKKRPSIEVGPKVIDDGRR